MNLPEETNHKINIPLLIISAFYVLHLMLQFPTEAR